LHIKPFYALDGGKMNRRKFIIAIMLMVMLSSACTLPFTIRSVDNTVSTLAAQTVQAWQTQNAPTQTKQSTWTPQATQSPFPTQTPYPTYTPNPTYTPLFTSTPKPLPTNSPQPCNQAFFVSETIPDNTKFSPNISFTKSWRFKNIGTCTWNPNYKIVFFSGDQMNGPSSVKLDDYVAPGEKIDILVNLKSPSKPGTYTGYWKLQADDGTKFAQVYLQIIVPSTPFKVSSIVLTSSPASYIGVCPKTFTIKAEITVTSTGKVTYKWKRSDGFTSELKSVTFDSKGTKTVQFDWVLTTSDTYWVKIYIDSPNNQWFGPLDIPVTCS
jgi:hypothetical protein